MFLGGDFYLLGYKVRNQGEAISKQSYLLQAGFLLGSFFDTEDGGEIFLRNFDCLSTGYMALYYRK
jgi:hypothetical protein